MTVTPIKVHKGTTTNLNQLGEVAMLQSALPDSVYIQWELNSTYQAQFTAWDDGSEAYKLLSVNNMVNVAGQWFVIKQVESDFSGGVNTVQVTATHIYKELANHRIYKGITTKWIDRNGKVQNPNADLNSSSGTDDENQATSTDPQGVIDHFFGDDKFGFTFTVHGSFSKSNVDLNQDLTGTDVFSLITESWSTAVIFPDNTSIGVYQSSEFFKNKGNRVDYLHDSSEVQLDYDITSVTNAARLIGGTYEKEETVVTGQTTVTTSTGGAGKVIADAKKYLGVPYVFGGAGGTRGGNPLNGMDCSSFTSQVYQDFGIRLPAYTVSQESYGHQISRAQVQTGDLGFYGGHGSSYHVVMALDNNTMIYEPEQGQSCKIATIASYPPSWWIRNDQMAAIVAGSESENTTAEDQTETNTKTYYYFTPFFYKNEESVNRWGEWDTDDITSETVQKADDMKKYADSQFHLNPDFSMTVTMIGNDRPQAGDVTRVEIKPVSYVANLKLVGYQWYPYNASSSSMLTFNSNAQTILNYQNAINNRLNKSIEEAHRQLTVTKSNKDWITTYVEGGVNNGNTKPNGTGN